MVSAPHCGFVEDRRYGDRPVPFLSAFLPSLVSNGEDACHLTDDPGRSPVHHAYRGHLLAGYAGAASARALGELDGFCRAHRHWRTLGELFPLAAQGCAVVAAK